MQRILIFIPMYNCAPQIDRVVAQFTPEVMECVEKIIFVDNRSTDNTLEVVKVAAATLPNQKYLIVRNSENYSLGGSHKVAFNYALEYGYTHVVVLHGDDQGRIADLLPFIRRGDHERFDCLLGARFMRGSVLSGYSLIRTLANYAFNLLFSLVTLRPIYDMGSGLNMYSRKSLEQRRYLNYANNLNFNHYMLLGTIDAGISIKFVPISWREDDQVSNAKLFRFGILTLRILSSYLFNRRHLLNDDHTSRPNKTYSYEVIGGQESANA